jgi:hypothetical protein
MSKYLIYYSICLIISLYFLLYFHFLSKILYMYKCIFCCLLIINTLLLESIKIKVTTLLNLAKRHILLKDFLLCIPFLQQCPTSNINIPEALKSLYHPPDLYRQWIKLMMIIVQQKSSQEEISYGTYQNLT